MRMKEIDLPAIGKQRGCDGVPAGKKRLSIGGRYFSVDNSHVTRFTAAISRAGAS
ncbi:hypothetical protein [Shouchella clausii]|uniref:hypothetical protein n=1 Tax=Shouchella clausii TaxID=79880 RepID=UPI0015CA45C3|nr:hypothetical protein [Shouchella clausii]